MAIDPLLEVNHEKIVNCTIDDVQFIEPGSNIYIALHGDLLKLAPDTGEITGATGFWLYYEPTAVPFDELMWGTYFSIEWTHPRKGHFID